jgi:predicted translin family RNA/ssDNA-binding protein
MNKTVMFLQADMHRAINSGRTNIEVSILDLKELIGEVMRAEAKETLQRTGQVLGFIRPEQCMAMASGKALYVTIRRKKDKAGEYCQPIYRDILDKSVEVISESSQDSA